MDDCFFITLHTHHKYYSKPVLQKFKFPMRWILQYYNNMDVDIPETSYSTIFHCDQSGFICLLRLLEGLVSVGMFWMFWKGYRAITRERNNRISKEDRWLYLLAMFQTFLCSLYYLLFEEFFMLATIRNLLIWISINVLNIFCILNWEEKSIQGYAQWAMYALQIVNFMMWFVISLGDGSSLENTDFNLGYNCMINDWILMSGILLAINLSIALLGYTKIDKLEFQLANLPPTETRLINLITRERISIILMICSGLVGSFIMFGWDFLAYHNSVDRLSCEHLFSGDSIFRNILCFLLKIISMQFNPAVIFYNVYYSRKEQFEKSTEEPLLEGEDGFDPFARGPSMCNITVSEQRRSVSNLGLALPSGRKQVSEYRT